MAATSNTVVNRKYKLVEGTYGLDRGNGLEFYDTGDPIEGLTEQQVKALGSQIKPLKGKAKSSEEGADGIQIAKEDEDREVVMEAEEEDEGEEGDEDDDSDEPYELGAMSIPEAVKSVASMDLPTATESYKQEKEGLNRAKVTGALANRIKTLKGQSK